MKLAIILILLMIISIAELISIDGSIASENIEDSNKYKANIAQGNGGHGGDGHVTIHECSGKCNISIGNVGGGGGGGGSSDPRPYRTNRCMLFKDLYGDDGKYLKSICSVREYLTYDQAKKACLSYGMDLLVIENEAVNRGLMSFMAENFNLCDEFWSCKHWINCEKISGKWFVFKNHRKFEMSSALPIRDEKEYPGNCLTLRGNYPYFEGGDFECPWQAWFLCEYGSQL